MLRAVVKLGRVSTPEIVGRNIARNIATATPTRPTSPTLHISAFSQSYLTFKSHLGPKCRVLSFLNYRRNQRNEGWKEKKFEVFFIIPTYCLYELGSSIANSRTILWDAPIPCPLAIQPRTQKRRVFLLMRHFSCHLRALAGRISNTVLFSCLTTPFWFAWCKHESLVAAHQIVAQNGTKCCNRVARSSNKCCVHYCTVHTGIYSRTW